MPPLHDCMPRPVNRIPCSLLVAALVVSCTADSPDVSTSDAATSDAAFTSDSTSSDAAPDERRFADGSAPEAPADVFVLHSDADAGRNDAPSSADHTGVLDIDAGAPDQTSVLDIDAGAGPDGSADAAVGDGNATACSGPVIQGSVVIRNSVDLDVIKGYARISGELRIEAPGLTSLSLPALCSVGGGVFGVDTPDLVELELPALTSVRTLDITGPLLRTINLDALSTVTGGMLSITADGPVGLPALKTVVSVGISSRAIVQLPLLESAGGVGITYGNGTLNLPNLRTVDDLDVRCSEACGPATLGALVETKRVSVQGAGVVAPKITSVVNLLLGRGNSDFDAPVQTITGDLGVYGDVNAKAFASLTSVIGEMVVSGEPTMPDADDAGAQARRVIQPFVFSKLTSVGSKLDLLPAGPAVSFPALQTVGGSFNLLSTVSDQQLSFPALVSVGASFTVSVAAQLLSFPSLTTIALGASFVGTGSGQTFSFPVLTALKGDDRFGSGIDLSGTFSAPALVSVERALRITRVASLDLPALQSVGKNAQQLDVSLCDGRLEIDRTDLQTLRLPSLLHACTSLGNVNTPTCTSSNLLLTSVEAPNYREGDLYVANNPLLPDCRAQMLVAQVGKGGVSTRCPGSNVACP